MRIVKQQVAKLENVYISCLSCLTFELENYGCETLTDLGTVIGLLTLLKVAVASSSSSQESSSSTPSADGPLLTGQRVDRIGGVMLPAIDLADLQKFGLANGSTLSIANKRHQNTITEAKNNDAHTCSNRILSGM